MNVNTDFRMSLRMKRISAAFLVMIVFQFVEFKSLSRYISINLGGGQCEWTPPSYDPPNGTFFSTLVVGYPGGSKRIIFSQLEALTGQAFNDEWPTFLNRPHRAFYKGNYPHHEGTWGFNNTMNQVIMIMRSPFQAIVEYHDVLNDINYATDAVTAFNESKNLYVGRPTLDEWRAWRDLRLPAEVHWYGWFIDYWMEGGLMRDIPSHRPVPADFFRKMLTIPGPYYESGMGYADIIGDDTVPLEYDPHCANDMPNGSCEPIMIISAERILDVASGHNETEKLASAVDGKEGIDVIAKEARPCIWDELMIRKKGLRNMKDRSGPEQSIYKYKLEYLAEMLNELNRLKTKYSLTEWSYKKTAQDLVIILDEYIDEVTLAIANGDYE